MTKFVRGQSDAMLQKCTFLRTAHHANVKHVSGWHICFWTARNTCKRRKTSSTGLYLQNRKGETMAQFSVIFRFQLIILFDYLFILKASGLFWKISSISLLDFLVSFIDLCYLRFTVIWITCPICIAIYPSEIPNICMVQGSVGFFTKFYKDVWNVHFFVKKKKQTNKQTENQDRTKIVESPDFCDKVFKTQFLQVTCTLARFVHKGPTVLFPTPVSN